MQHYMAGIGFYNEGERYGAETVFVSAASQADAETFARNHAVLSRYDDARLPDRHVDVVVEEIEWDEVPEGETVHSAPAMASP